MELLFGEWSLRVHQPRKNCLGVALMVCRWLCLVSARTRLLQPAFLVS
jgi:hypothetical protein